MKKQVKIGNSAKVELKELLAKTKSKDFRRFNNLENDIRNLNIRVNRIERKVGLTK